MKTNRIFPLAVLALMMVACNNDDSALQSSQTTEGIPFTATISGNATTRALTENMTDKKLEASWAINEEMALIHNDVVDKMTVSAIDADGTATITGTITGSPKDGDDVQVVYPYSAVDLTNKEIKADLLAQQDGTLASIVSKLDLRVSSGAKLKVGLTAATFDGTVSLKNQLAIVKFSLTDGTDALAAESFEIQDGSGQTITTVTSSPSASEFYVAMEPASSQAYLFIATKGDVKYIYSKPSATIAAGKYYQSTVTMLPETTAGTITFATAAPSQTWSATAADNTYQQQATVDGDAVPTYSISDNTCGATIDASTGVVTFTKAGSVKVTATVADTETYTYETKTATYTLTVSKAAGSISYATQTVEKTTSDAAFTNTLTKVGDGAVTYSSDKESVATVNSTTGEVTIKGAGEATITATVADSDTYTYATTTATYKVTVKAVVVGALDQYGNGGDPLN